MLTVLFQGIFLTRLQNKSFECMCGGLKQQKKYIVGVEMAIIQTDIWVYFVSGTE